MAKRVFELARELGVTSKVVLTKCRAEGIDVKNHMSTLSVGLEATVRDWFSEEASGTAVETAEHVDLAKARKEAKKTRHRRKKAPEAPIEAADVAAEPAEPPAEVQVAAEAPAEPEAGKAEAAPPEEPSEAAEAEAQEESIKPAGPQVVPKPATLKGPRVVRVERPDVLQRPPSARAGLISEGPPTLGVATKRAKQLAEQEEEEAKKRKKTKRRSPRRRGGGRSADGGEKIREWRNQDLQERSQRLAAAGTGLRRHRPAVSQRSIAARPGAKVGRVEIDEPITVKSLSAATGLKAVDIIKRLMGMEIMATVNQVIGRETAEAVALDYDIELAVRRAKTAEEEVVEKFESRPVGQTSSRAPVVTFLGHVDHGKTSLLDQIRNTAVAEGEAGGITQHIGACRYDKEDKHVVFLDTPGHEAFTAMRARGANMTDVVVLVVAADDGVMPQTVEAISHAKAAGVPIIVALNKIDVQNANIQRAMGQLAEQDLQPREWGGNVEVLQTSAVTGQGIDDLVETLSLEAELLELRAEADAPASGYVIEAQMDPGRGVVTSLLVRNGTLKVGDIVLAGRSYGRVRHILDDRGRSVKQALPSTPVEVAGLDEVPEAGDRFFVLDDIEQVRAVAEEHRALARSESLAAAPQRSLESLLGRIQAGEINELALIIKADVQGSVEALIGSLEKLGTDDAKVNILHSSVGGISTGDVSLAEASNAIIIGFNVVPDAAARQQAEAKGVDIRLYRVIYDITKDIRKALEEGLAPEIREETLGHAEVRQVFKVSRVGTIAGCYVTDGKVTRNTNVRIIRDNVVIEDKRSLESLKRFKDD
ncbi:MAG: translation initiation factor IF-2, partial [Phycisphaerae bacterium]|nr:translation initiation factor IF-2 [Phycisphaerae bacterium]